MEHVPVNTALLKTIRLAFPHDKISFYAEEAHLEFVREQIGKKIERSISWRKMVLPPRQANFFWRLAADFRIVKSLLKNLDENSGKDVLVITGNASILWALKYYTANSHSKKNIQVILHGDFSTINRTPRREILNPFYYAGCLKTALKLNGYQRLQHIVLEESVRSAIIQHMPFLQNSLFVFDHPVPVDEDNKNSNDSFNQHLDFPVQFGFLGYATEKKGFSQYLDVASEISMQFPGQANFHVIGQVSEEYKRKNFSKMAYIGEIPQKESPLNRNEYVDRLKCLHYVCMFYDKHYEFCASGVLMDSIAWEKPIIASQLMIFKNLQKRFGDIGYLCRKNEIAGTIRSILRAKDSTIYKRQVLNIRKLKTSRAPEALALKYSELASLLRLE